jgi:PDZ domain-containing protein
LVDLLTPIDILQGRKIAGTGTISADGKVGPIGGVVEKIVGAKSVGAEIIIISTANCSELPAAVEGISVVAVSTLAQALTYLRDDASASPLTNSGVANSGVRSAGIQGCASVGA